MTVHRGEQGFTLIEVMISLGLFALIAVAGLGLVDSVLNVQGRTEKRLDRIADYNRAMFIVSSDFDQVTRGAIAGGGETISFSRVAPGFGGQPQPVQYAAAGGTLTRIAGAAPQRVLTGVGGAAWRFYWQGGWIDRWPPSDEQKQLWPQAVALDVQVDGGGMLRRVVPLPAQPDERP